VLVKITQRQVFAKAGHKSLAIGDPELFQTGLRKRIIA
jgi:hypothetical protein